MKLSLYQYVALNRDISEYHLKRGDVAMLIDYVTHPSGGEDGYILEVFNAAGDSIAVFTVPMSAVTKLTGFTIEQVKDLPMNELNDSHIVKDFMELSESSLSKVWLNPEEDKAWNNL